MDQCPDCPGGDACRGQVLHALSLKLLAALETAQEAEAVGRALDADERRRFADVGAAAGPACWTRAFVLTCARRIAALVAAQQGDEQLRYAIAGLFSVMDGLFARLPNGIVLDLDGLALDIYNGTCAELEKIEGAHFVSANIVAQAWTAFLQRRGG